MKIYNFEQEGNKAKFIFEGERTVANALRRAVLGEIPCVAIDEVDFYENSSSLFDEFIAHRLGMIPLISDPQMEGEVILRLEAEGPKMVYSGDLKSTDPQIRPMYDNIPIIKLLDGQRLVLDAKARLGYGKKHAKFQAGYAFYKKYPKITIGKKCDGCGQCVNICPKGILKMEKGKLIVTNIEECIKCKLCEEKCPKGAIKVGEEKGKYIFYIESYNNYTPKQIVNLALDALIKRVQNIRKGVQK